MRSRLLASLAASLPLLFWLLSSACGSTSGGQAGDGSGTVTAGFGGNPWGLAGSAGSGGSGALGGSAGSAGALSGVTFCDHTPPTSGIPISVPSGFCIRSYLPANTVLPEPRVIRVAPNGDVFVTTPSAFTPGGASGGDGAIHVLPDDDHDGIADQVLTYIGPTPGGADCFSADADPTYLSCVHGLAFHEGYLYFSRSNDVRRFPYSLGDRKAPSNMSELVASLGIPSGASAGFRWTHSIDFAPNGEMLVARGVYEAGGCDASTLGNGNIQGFLLGSLPATGTVIADGFRDPLYLRCNGMQCFTNELTGDGWDGLGGHEKLIQLAPNEHFGYPCCVDKNQPVPGANASLCTNLSNEVLLIQLHDTPFGLDFEPGGFPAPYTNGIFIAKHGAVGSETNSDVVYVAVSNGVPMGMEQPFTSGFGFVGNTNNGRATDLTFAPDGRMFLIDDTNGAVYWIAPTTLQMPAP